MNGILIPPERRLWLCRAESGIYLDHFVEFGVVGLSHIDRLLSADGLSAGEQLDSRVRNYFAQKKSSSSKSTTNQMNQALRFVNEPSIGDLILSVGSGTVMIGEVQSDAYVQHKKLTLIKVDRFGNEKATEMHSFCRRDVNWIKRVRRGELPFSLAKGITGNQTFFNLDDYKDEIYALLSAYVYEDGILKTNLMIKRENDISTYDVTRLTTLFIKAEFIATQIQNLPESISVAALDELFFLFCRGQNISSSLIAEFSSPGWIGNKSLLTAVQVLTFAAAVNSCVGGGTTSIEVVPIKLKNELHELIPENARQHFFLRAGDVLLDALERWLEPESRDLKQKLKLQKPTTDGRVANRDTKPGQQ